MPLAWLLALSARHSSMQAFAVFCWAIDSEENATNANIAEQTEIKSCFLILPPPARNDHGCRPELFLYRHWSQMSRGVAKEDAW
jgi:hypothetical protein